MFPLPHNYLSTFPYFLLRCTLLLKTYQLISLRPYMIGSSWLASRYIQKSRESYNASNYHRSRRFAKMAHLLKKTRNSYDLLARTNLRIKNFDEGRKIYKKAENKGLRLLDHNENRFKCEIGSASFVGAYDVILRLDEDENKKTKLRILSKNIKKLSDKEKINVLEEISIMGKMPKELAKLLPLKATKKNKISDISPNNSLKRISPEDLIIDRYRRELSRITSTGTYRIMNHISSSLHSPMKILYLPVSTSILMLNLLKGRLGGLSSKRRLTLNGEESHMLRNSIVLFPTNGVGFGHFTRMLALAKSIRKISPDTEIVFFTTMPTLHLLSEYNFIGYHIPGRYRYRDMDPKVWNTLCEEMLNLVLLQHKPSHFVFDGAYPYRGMLNAISNINSGVNKIWLKRPSVKSNVKKLPIDSYDYFDSILKPGDSTHSNFEEEYDHNLNLHEINPMLIYDRHNTDSSQSLRLRLDIPQDSVVAYVQLGAGKINNIEGVLEIVLQTLLKYPQCYVVMAESLIGDRLRVGQDRLRLLRDFPNSKWFHDIDFSIIAGGYNSYHEMVEFCVPSIVIPNTATGRDDQVSRIKPATEQRAMVMLKNPDKLSIEVAVDRMMEIEVRKEMSDNLHSLRKPNGSDEAAIWIIQP